MALAATLALFLAWLGAATWRLGRLRALAARAQRRAEAAMAAQRVAGADLLALLASHPEDASVHADLAVAYERLVAGDPTSWEEAMEGLAAAPAALPTAAGPLLASLLPGLEEQMAARRAAAEVTRLLEASRRSVFLDPWGRLA